jgi:hypothetical protein
MHGEERGDEGNGDAPRGQEKQQDSSSRPYQALVAFASAGKKKPSPGHRRDG